MIGVALLVTALGVLVTAFAVRRGWLSPAQPANLPPKALETALLLALLLAVNAKLVAALLRGPFLAAGDLRSHAMVVRELALGRVHAGYVDAYLGGFPLGPHYPVIGWLLSVPLIWLGMPAVVAVCRIGIAAVLLFNLLVYGLARRAGASAGSAICGAVLVSIVSPITGFIGGVQAVLMLGLLSQVVAMPATLLHAYNVVFGRSLRGLALTSALVVLAHPQVAVALCVLLALAAAARGGVAWRRWCFAVVLQGLVGAAVFGPGIASLSVPFGWPPLQAWSIVGRPVLWFLSWLSSGDAFDFAREPVVTAAIASSLLVLVIWNKGRDVRGVLGVVVAAILLCLAGSALTRAGATGTLLLSFLQPLRAYSLLPAVAAAVVVVATNRAQATLHPRRWLAVCPPLFATAWLLTAAPADVWSEWQRTQRSLGAPKCVAATAPLGKLLAGAAEGRLFYAEDDLPCKANPTLDFASPGPIASPVAVGAHVGVLWDAMRHLDPAADGADVRADVLGVGTIVHVRSKPPRPASAFRELGEAGGLVVSERVPAASYFGLACVTREWRGSDRVVRDALLEAFHTGNSQVWSKTELVALESSGSATRVSTALSSACDAARAKLLTSKRVAPGHYTASVEADAPVDLVLKETAYHGWQIRVDGEQRPFRLVAPGFMAVRLAPGKHQVDAQVAWDLRYWLGVVAALLVAAAFTEHARRSRWQLAFETL